MTQHSHTKRRTTMEDPFEDLEPKYFTKAGPTQTIFTTLFGLPILHVIGIAAVIFWFVGLGWYLWENYAYAIVRGLLLLIEYLLYGTLDGKDPASL
ncbi:hypothetical protein PBI_BEEBEE8_32 [Microbacterium phage BeeBee8]|uniref:Uncharacterized protein n=1 Tax=Microbacterium phage BeeBee8 TaxID=2126924 RepID=A0A2R3ZZD6_9CAUD|nr:hypothetical protein PBI_BEEBEE8_32 [Microbacterium phage BeeBee8]